MIIEIKREVDKKQRFINNVETFAFCLRAGLVKPKNPDQNNIWNYMSGKEPVTINLTTAKSFDRKYYLYNVFKKFVKMDTSRIESIKDQAIKLIESDNQVDYKSYIDHINMILSDEYLGDPFNWEEINDEAYSVGVADNYQISDINYEEPDPANDLQRFYKLLLTSMI